MENKGLRQTGLDTKGPSFYWFHLPTKVCMFQSGRCARCMCTTHITSTYPRKETYSRQKQVWNPSLTNRLALELLAGVWMRHYVEKQKQVNGSCATQCPAQHGLWLMKVTSKECSSQLCSPTSPRICYLQLSWSDSPSPTPLVFIPSVIKLGMGLTRIWQASRDLDLWGFVYYLPLKSLAPPPGE